ncbi:SoxR reducing system RseC family protein [Marinospirillum sp. MEB164]|uniref:SoxR reducing system RseC family protein n=1 Tax=Marinospirillum alkalitolerans TaxID=3123374 RepID=A0ABW8PXU8_9GAMM
MTSQITQPARVTARSGDRVQLQPVAVQGCQSCQLAGGCGQGVVARWLKKAPPVIELPAPASVRVGDLVELGVSSPALMRAAAWQYLLPLFCALFSVVLVDALMAPTLLVQALAALLGLVLGLALAERWAAKVQLELILPSEPLVRSSPS